MITSENERETARQRGRVTWIGDYSTMKSVSSLDEWREEHFIYCRQQEGWRGHSSLVRARQTESNKKAGKKKERVNDQVKVQWASRERRFSEISKHHLRANLCIACVALILHFFSLSLWESQVKQVTLALSRFIFLSSAVSSYLSWTLANSHLILLERL